MERYYKIPLIKVKGFIHNGKQEFRYSQEYIIAEKTSDGYKDIMTELEFKKERILEKKDGNYHINNDEAARYISRHPVTYFFDELLEDRVSEATSEEIYEYCENFSKSDLRKYIEICEQAEAIKSFKPLSQIQIQRLPRNEMIEYYRNLRQYLFEHGKDVRYKKLQEAIHPILRKGLTINRTINRQKSRILLDQSPQKSTRPIIYAVTHVGKYDMEIVCEKIDDSFHIMCGDPETMYRNADGMLIQANGVIYVDTESIYDRFIAKETGVNRLNNGINILMYPEGTWNTTTNKPVLPLFPGIVEMAYRSNALVVPIGIEQYENNFDIRIGDAIDVNRFFQNGSYDKEGIKKAKQAVRDAMATEKYKIWEFSGDVAYDSIEKDESAITKARLAEWPYYTTDTLKERTFREPGIVSAEEVFTFQKK